MKIANKLRAIAKSLDIDFALDADPQTFWLRVRGETPEDDEAFTLRVVSDHWLYVAPSPRLFEKALANHAEHAVLLYSLLRENDKTKSGRFFIDDEGFVSFAVDLRMADLSKDLLDDTLNLIHYVTKERLPDLAGVHEGLLFKGSANGR